MLHLEEYIDTLEALPMELQRQFTLMRELDALSQDIQEQLKTTTEEFVESPPTKDDPRHMEYIRSFIQLFSTVLKHGEEKVALATQTYDLVDRHIRKLDDDLSRFEERQLSMPQRIPHAWGPGDTPAEEELARADGGARRIDDIGSSRKKRANNREPSPLASTKSNTPGRKNAHRNGAGRTEAVRSRVAKASAPKFADMPIDPNEPRYCYCQQVSYGEMVACDNDNCEIEWFHLGCVNLDAPPKGQWFCSDCSAKHKKRRDNRP